MELMKVRKNRLGFQIVEAEYILSSFAAFLLINWRLNCISKLRELVFFATAFVTSWFALEIRLEQPSPSRFIRQHVRVCYVDDHFPTVPSEPPWQFPSETVNGIRGVSVASGTFSTSKWSNQEGWLTNRLDEPMALHFQAEGSKPGSRIEVKSVNPHD